LIFALEYWFDDYDDYELWGIKMTDPIVVSNTTGINLGNLSVTMAQLSGTVQINIQGAPAPQELDVIAFHPEIDNFIIGWAGTYDQGNNTWQWYMRMDDSYVGTNVLFHIGYWHEDYGSNYALIENVLVTTMVHRPGARSVIIILS
jgi:hypothetical protein